jgi:aryl-alcohol dehydrogenase-like predicted oxidoreductase
MKRLALGTAQFGLNYGIANRTGKVSLNEVSKILTLASHNEINTIDTAIGYGESESCLGESGLVGFNVVTKLMAIPLGSTDVSKWVKQEMFDSLNRLNKESIYALLLHRAEDLLGPHQQALWKAMTDLKQSGLIKKIGVSVYDPTILKPILEKYPIDLVQAPFNLIDKRLLQTGWLHRLKDNGIEVHVRSAFLQGLLLMCRSSIPHIFNQWNDIWDRWHSFLLTEKKSAHVVCLQYVLSYQEVDKVVVGVDSSEQLSQLLVSATGIPVKDYPCLSSEDLTLIDPSKWSKQ